MTTAIKMSQIQDVPQVNNVSIESEYKLPKFSISKCVTLEIFMQMEQKQIQATNYIFNIKLENLRKNFISWLFVIAPRLTFSKLTLFNTISMMDYLFSRMNSEDYSDSKYFQLFAVICFFISFKFFEKKTISLSFVENSLLHGKWNQTEIRQAEIFILQKVDYKIDYINPYSFYQFFKIIIKCYFEETKVEQISFIAKYVLQKAVKLGDIVFSLTPLAQAILILNTTFLIMQNLTNFDIEQYSYFFLEMANLTVKQHIRDFEKFSSFLVNNITFSEDFLEKLSNIDAIKG
jgi:hypothetical protein